MGKIRRDVGERKIRVKFREGFLWCVNEQMASTDRVLMRCYFRSCDDGCVRFHPWDFFDTREGEFDFVSQLDESRMDEKQPEHRMNLCRKDRRWDSTVPGMFASMVSFKCLMFLCFKAITWRSRASETPAWKIMCWDASRVR